MNRKKYNQLRMIVSFFVATFVAIAVNLESYLLLVSSVAAGMSFMTLVRTKTKISIDERESTIQEKAAKMTYIIFAPTLGIGALLLLLPSYGGLSVFAKGEFSYLESLGMVFAYLTLFMIAIYSISYYFLNRKYGGGNNE